jgi:hypothetical protein
VVSEGLTSGGRQLIISKVVRRARVNTRKARSLRNHRFVADVVGHTKGSVFLGSETLLCLKLCLH